MKKLHTILLALGIIFLVVLIGRAGLSQLWRQLALLGWGLIPIVIAEGVAELFHAVSWRYCLSQPYCRTPLSRLVRIHFAGYAIGYLTPTAFVTGEVAKAALLAEPRHRPEAVSAVLVGKLSFALAHIFFVAAGSIVLLPVLQLAPALRSALLLVSGALAVGTILFLLLQKHGKLSVVVKWLVARNILTNPLQRLVLPLERLDETLKSFHRERPWDLARSVSWHVLGYSVGIFATWYVLFLLTDSRGWAVAARVWCLVMWFDLVTFAVPLSLGALEGGRLVAFQTLGFGALSGMTFGIATRLAQLFWVGLGLFNYALLLPRKTPIRRKPTGLESRVLVAQRRNRATNGQSRAGEEDVTEVQFPPRARQIGSRLDFGPMAKGAGWTDDRTMSLASGTNGGGSMGTTHRLPQSPSRKSNNQSTQQL
jgi:hypothetical protein